MIIVQVQHHLNREGQVYFDEWLRHTASVLRCYEGFKGLRRLQSPEAPDRCMLQLSFDDDRRLQAWVQSTEHDLMVKRLEPYATEPFQVRRYLAGPSL